MADKYRMKTIADQITEVPTTCCLPFMQLRVQSTDATVMPCCVYQGDVGESSTPLQTIWFGKEMNQLRETMLTGATPDACNRCDSPTSGRSYRDFKNERFSNMAESNQVTTSVDQYPTVLDIVTGSTCNLACRMCSAVVSSKIDDIATPKLRTFVGKRNEKADILSLIGSPEIMTDVQFLLLTGGEPFIEKNTQKVLDLAKDYAPKLNQIHLSTNMSVVNRKMLDSLANLGCSVSISISIDGDKPTHEYIRSYSDYDAMVNNARIINSEYLGVFSFEVNTTISSMNAFRTDRTLASILDFEHNTGITFTNMLVAPVQEPYNHPGVLPDHTKEIVRKINNQLPDYLFKIPGSRAVASTALAMVEAKNQMYFGKFIALMKEFDSITGKIKEEELPEIFNR